MKQSLGTPVHSLCHWIGCAWQIVLSAPHEDGIPTSGRYGAPTGRAGDQWVVTIMHFEGDKVVREWIGADKLGLFIQLGVLDDPWPR